MKKIYQHCIASVASDLVASTLLTGVSAATAQTKSVRNDFSGWHRMYLLLHANGSPKDDTLNKTKLYSNRFVSIEEVTITTAGTLPLYLRVRDGKTKAAATDGLPLQVYESHWRANYLPGSGVVNRTYFVRGQTSSASPYSASMTGCWMP